MSFAPALTTIMAAACLIGIDGDGRAAQGPSTSADGMVSRLRAEAARLDAGCASELFTALADPKMAARLDLDAEQAGLVRRIDQMAQEVQRLWLTRGLDDPSSQSARELADRLGEGGSRLRAALVAHAEAIAIEGVLEPRQAQRLLKLLDRKPQRPLPGRYMSFRVPSGEPPPTTKGDYDFHLRFRARALQRPNGAASELFRVMLGWDEALYHRPNPLGPSREQADMMQRLNDLIQDVEAGWFLRGLEGAPPVPKGHRADPPTPTMVERLDERGERVRTSLIAHAEEIALLSVLDPERAAKAKRLRWSRSGLTDLVSPKVAGDSAIAALLDPEVAAALRLSASQREQLADRLAERAVLVRKLSGRFAMEEAGLLDDRSLAEEDRRERISTAATTCRSSILAAEQPVWDILTKSQIRAFRRLLKGPDADKPAEPPEKKAGPSRTGRRAQDQRVKGTGN